MRTQSPDTHPDAEAVLIQGYRRMSVAEKLRCMEDLVRFASGLQRADIRRRHPRADEREVALRLASRWLEPELMRLAFGWDPDREGY